MPSPPAVLRELAEAAVLWRKTKVAYLAVADSKKSKESETLAARKAHLQAVQRLEKAVVAFEKLEQQFRRNAGKMKSKKPLNWKGMIDGIAVAATALSKATDGQRPQVQVVDVIDVKSE